MNGYWQALARAAGIAVDAAAPIAGPRPLSRFEPGFGDWGAEAVEMDGTGATEPTPKTETVAKPLTPPSAVLPDPKAAAPLPVQTPNPPAQQAAALPGPVQPQVVSVVMPPATSPTPADAKPVVIVVAAKPEPPPATQPGLAPLAAIAPAQPVPFEAQVQVAAIAVPAPQADAARPEPVAAVTISQLPQAEPLPTPPDAAPAATPRDNSPPAPIIIEIGRIEVRLTQPAAAPPMRRPQQHPVVSLNDYLETPRSLAPR